jgi:hypothetical protein
MGKMLATEPVADYHLCIRGHNINGLIRQFMEMLQGIIKFQFFCHGAD